MPGSAALGEKIAGEFRKNPDYKAVIMENHGVVLCGEDIADAYQRFETLELCARTILNAKTLGEPHYLTEEELLFHENHLIGDFEHFMNVTHPSDERAIRSEIVRLVRRACNQKLMSSSLFMSVPKRSLKPKSVYGLTYLSRIPSVPIRFVFRDVAKIRESSEIYKKRQS